ncbi:uncharacterized protein LOC124266312 isoform X2 [Haliotis rubra]|uniref:uncharacterized protein LOC124266312 isoform X2 n=1 Tax=Haliotis rubra TaxID=36100 RepID=UPI001EE5E432|nr:uncharacterized protein LOC124266312 isoform X2 [Haliotis rubra]
MASAVSLLIFVLALWVQPSIQWSGHYCPYNAVNYETRRGQCIARCWWWRCCAYGSVTVPVYTRRYKCCAGWIDYRGNQNCNRRRCTCGTGYTGASCTERTG